MSRGTAHRPRKRTDERGIALLIALVTVSLVTISVIQFTHSRQVDYRRAAHWVQARQAQLYADDATEVARILLAADRVTDAVTGEGDGLTEDWATRLCAPPPPRSCRTNFAYCPLPALDGTDNSIAVRIEDMSGLYNLNRLRRRHNTDVEREVLEDLFTMSDVSPDLIGPIVDWIDSDGSLYRYGAGAEAPQYGDTLPPYAPRNGELTSFRELALIKGVKHDDLVKLHPLVSVLPSDAVESININTAPIAVLRALRSLDSVMGDESLINAIVAERCVSPFKSADDLRARIPQFPTRVNTERWIRFESSYFRVLATARVDEVYQSIEALLHRTDQGIRVVYYLARRGAVIPGVDLSYEETAHGSDFLGARRIGAF